MSEQMTEPDVMGKTDVLQSVARLVNMHLEAKLVEGNRSHDDRGASVRVVNKSIFKWRARLCLWFGFEPVTAAPQKLARYERRLSRKN